MNIKNIVTNPWKDIAAYNISDAYRFKGRKNDIERFLRIVKSGTMSVLYANSGIGKTSFINAGIIPPMLMEGYFPIHVLFPDHVLQNDSIEGWLFQELSDRVNKNGLDGNNDFCWKESIKQEDETWKQSIWWLLNTCHIYQSSTGRTFKPLIIFDQFEEVFTKSNKEKKTNVLDNLFKLVGELSSTSFPRTIEQALDVMYANGKYIEISNTKQYKIIFSLRKEYLSDFDYWTNDKNAVTELHQNRMFLLPLTRLQAEEVITKQPLSKDNLLLIETLSPIKDKIIDLIDTKQRDEVEPFILSILCSNLFKKAQSENKEFLSEQDVKYNAETLILKFYEENVNQIFVNKSHLNRFEESLVDSDGQRNRIKTKALDGISFEQNYQDCLEKRHLIRIDKYNDENYVELIHDRIADAIKERRRINKQKKQVKGWNLFWFFIIIVAAFWAIRVITVSPTKSPNYLSDVSEYTNLDLTSIDTSAFKEKGHLENSHMVERLTISDTTVVYIDNCSYLKELVLELPKGEQSIRVRLNNCPQLRSIIIPDTAKELSYYVNNCPAVKLPIGPNVDNLYVKTDNSDCSFSFIVNNSNFSWEEAVPYQESQSNGGRQFTRKDSTLKHNYTLWDKRNGKLLYAQYNVPDKIYFPQYHSDDNSFTIWYSERIGGREIKNASNYNVINKEQKNIFDTISVRNVHAEDVTNADVEFIYLTDSVKYISPSAFKKCKKLKSIRFSPNICTIYEKAFQGCVQLDSITLPDSLSYISEYAFEGCDNLRYVHFGNANSLFLSEGAFAKCKNLETIEFTGGITSYYRLNEGDPYFFNPFFECPKLNNIVLKYPDESNLFIKDNIAFDKSDSIPIFITGPRCNYNHGDFYSYEGTLLEKKNETNIIWFLADPKHHALSSLYQSSNDVHFRNIFFEDQRHVSYIVSHNIPKELFHPTSTGRGIIKFVYPPDSLKTLHIPYAQPANQIYSLKYDIPDSLAQNIEIVVPYGCSKYYVNNPNFSSFKSIKEENFWISQINTIKFFAKNTTAFFTRHWWGIPSFIIGCLLMFGLIFLARIKNLKERGIEIDKKKIIFFSITRLVLAIILYTITYWICVGYWPGRELSNNVIAVLLSLLILLIIVFGRNNFLVYIDKFYILLNKTTQIIIGKKNNIYILMHSNEGKQKMENTAHNILKLISILFTCFVIILVHVETNDINTMLERKDYQRAFSLIYKQALRTDSISKPIQEEMRRILVDMRAIPGLPDSISISGEKVTVDNDNEVVYIERSDSVITFDIKNKKRYITSEKYNLSKLGKVMYNDNGKSRTFISVCNLSKKFTTSVKTNDWRLMCSERFVAMKSDTMLYVYDLENKFECRRIPLSSSYIIWGEADNDKYFAVRYNTGITKIYVLPEFKELVFDKPSVVCGFVNNQVISYDPDWERGQTHLMNIDEFFQETASYHGLFSCLSVDQRSFLITTDSRNIYWWSLKDNDSFKGFLPRSLFRLTENTTYSSQKFSVLRKANKLVLKFLNDYNIPSEYGLPIGETNSCLVFSNENAHITRIINLEKPNESPVIIKNAWPTMITSENRSYLQICNSESRWQSDSTSIYYGQKRIITDHYNRLHLSSNYAISGGWSEDKTFYPLCDKSKESRKIKIDGYLPSQLSIMEGWLFAALGQNLKVYNFLTLEDLIHECCFYTEEQKENLIGILKSPSKNK